MRLISRGHIIKIVPTCVAYKLTYSITIPLFLLRGRNRRSCTHWATPLAREIKKIGKNQKWKDKVSVDYSNKYLIKLESIVRNFQPSAEPWLNQQCEMQIAVLEMTVRKPSFDNFNNADTEYTAAYLGLIFLDHNWPDKTTST